LELNISGGRSSTKVQILEALLKAGEPIGVDELARQLSISRSAVYQHMATLERDRMIEPGKISQTKGRPGQTFQLTDIGRNQFPKHYSLFAGLLIELIEKRLGDDELQGFMEALGEQLADRFRSRVAGLNEGERLGEIAKIMGELGYEAQVVERGLGGASEITAYNCVFHEIAREKESVCKLDLALLSELYGGEIEHLECMVRGGGCCRFRPGK